MICTHSKSLFSAVLGSPASARKLGDIFVTLACQTRLISIHTSLIYNGVYLTRPLVRFKDSNNSTILFQFYPDGHMHRRALYYSTLWDHAQNAIFRISKLFVHFKNYSFIPIDHHVVELPAVKLESSPEIDLDLDFEESFHALHQFASTDLDRNNCLSPISTSL